MSMPVSIQPESGLLRVIATGEFSLKDAESTFLEVLDAVARHKTGKILFDGREIVGDPETIERFFYGEFAAHAVARRLIESGVLHLPQFAYVLHEPVLDPKRFGETVAVNRGMWVKVFDNVEDALEWLGLPSAKKPEASDV
jgi:hypothetical protein